MTKLAHMRMNLGADNLDYGFLPISTVAGDGVELLLKNKFLYSDAKIPGYDFTIFSRGQEAGTITALIEREFEKIALEGNIGAEINRSFHGEQLPAKAISALLPLLRQHGLDAIMITCDANNHAVERNCDALKAKFLDTVDSTEVGTRKRRYVLGLANTKV